MENYNDKCDSVGCEYFVRWEYYGCEMISCKLQGQSEDITEIAEDYPFKKELKELEDK